MDVVSVPTMLQIAGRVHRIGQTFKQHVILLTVLGTFDTDLQLRAAKKHVAMLAGTLAKEELTKKQYAELRKNPTHEHRLMAMIKAVENDEHSKMDPWHPKNIRGFQDTLLIEDKAIVEHGRLLGQRLSRAGTEWQESADIEARKIIDLAFADQINEGECLPQPGENEPEAANNGETGGREDDDDHDEDDEDKDDDDEVLFDEDDICLFADEANDQADTGVEQTLAPHGDVAIIETPKRKLGEGHDGEEEASPSVKE